MGWIPYPATLSLSNVYQNIPSGHFGGLRIAFGSQNHCLGHFPRVHCNLITVPLYPSLRTVLSTYYLW